MGGPTEGSTAVPVGALEYKIGPSPLEEGRRVEPDSVPGVYPKIDQEA